MPILSTEINAAQTNSTQFVDLPGLVITLPPGTETLKHALVTLNIPAAFCNGLALVDFGINFNGALVASGQTNFPLRVTGDLGGIQGSESFTLVTRVKLGTANTKVRAQWKVGNVQNTASVRGSTSFTATIA